MLITLFQIGITFQSRAIYTNSDWNLIPISYHLYEFRLESNSNLTPFILISIWILWNTTPFVVYVVGIETLFLVCERYFLHGIQINLAYFLFYLFFKVLSKSTHEWPRVTTSVSRLRVTTNDHEWPRVILKVIK